MAQGLRKVAALPDPVGQVVDGWVRPNGLSVQRVRVPLGVVGIIYENRPNVTSDAAGLCLKSGNAVDVAGSSSAIATNTAVAAALRDGLVKAGLPADAVVLVEDTSRDAAVAFMQLEGFIDCLIPRVGRRWWGRYASWPPCPRSSTGGELPRIRGQSGGLVHGRVDRRQRQDPTTGRVQQRRKRSWCTGPWPRSSCPACPGP